MLRAKPGQWSGRLVPKETRSDRGQPGAAEAAPVKGAADREAVAVTEELRRILAHMPGEYQALLACLAVHGTADRRAVALRWLFGAGDSCPNPRQSCFRNQAHRLKIDHSIRSTSPSASRPLLATTATTGMTCAGSTSEACCTCI